MGILSQYGKVLLPCEYDQIELLFNYFWKVFQNNKIGVYDLHKGIVVPIGFDKIEFRDGKSYEGVGMSPDIYIRNTIAEIEKGQDKTLERAIDEF